MGRRFDPDHRDVRGVIKRYARGSRWYQKEVSFDPGVRSSCAGSMLIANIGPGGEA